MAISRLQGQIAATDLAYARDLITYQNERFLSRDFWDALAGVARRSLHRYLDLAGQAAWFAERALAYQLAAPLKVIRLGYFDPRMRDVGGVDRLSLDLAELEAVRLGSARVSLPLTRTYSLARNLPLAFGQLKQTGRCTFTLTDDDLLAIRALWSVRAESLPTWGFHCSAALLQPSASRCCTSPTPTRSASSGSGATWNYTACPASSCFRSRALRSRRLGHWSCPRA